MSNFFDIAINKLVVEARGTKSKMEVEKELWWNLKQG
jgi:hypothetical protein